MNLTENKKWVLSFVLGTALIAVLSLWNFYADHVKNRKEREIKLAEFSSHLIDLLGLKPVNPYMYEWKYYRGDPFGNKQKMKLEQARMIIDKMKILDDDYKYIGDFEFLYILQYRDIPTIDRYVQESGGKFHYPELYEMYAIISDVNGQHEKADEYYSKAIIMAPDNTSINLGYATMLHSNNKNSESIKLLETLRERVPSDIDVLNRLVHVYLESNNTEKAERLINFAFDFELANADTHNAKGVYQMVIGIPHNAIVSYEEGLKLAPFDPILNQNIAHAYEAIGKLEKAKKHEAIAVENWNLPEDLKNCRAIH